MISFCCLGLLGSSPGFYISLSRAGEKVDKMHHVSQCWCGGKTGFCLPAQCCCRCQAGHCLWFSGEVKPQDILDCQKQVMFSFTPALLPIERAERCQYAGEKLQWNCTTAWGCEKVWSVRAAPAAQRLSYPHCLVWWVSQGGQLRGVHLRPFPVGQRTLTSPSFSMIYRYLLS